MAKWLFIMILAVMTVVIFGLVFWIMPKISPLAVPFIIVAYIGLRKYL